MIKIIGVRFAEAGKVYYFDPGECEIEAGSHVVVETARGVSLGEVVLGAREVEESRLAAPLRGIMRVATEEDVNHAEANSRAEQEAFEICQRKIKEHQMDMKLVNAEIAFDNSRILFNFTANGRVDFRSLVKDLASVFHTRIELRQIGARDEARMLGGLGPCGRPICCGAFLTEMQPVSIKMAKDQNLSLNPTKISGICGRLMCCLKYEQDSYEQTRRRMPKIGREVETPDGKGTVTELNVVRETVRVRLMKGDTAEEKDFRLEELTKLAPQREQAPAEEAPHEEQKGEETAEERRAPVRRERRQQSAAPRPVRRQNPTAPDEAAPDPVAPRAERKPRPKHVNITAPDEAAPDFIAVAAPPAQHAPAQNSWREQLARAKEKAQQAEET